MPRNGGAAEGGAGRIVVVGAGIVGLSIAARLAQAGRPVVLCDPDPAGGATFAAAGMLAPVSEYHYQEDELLPLLLASAARYPDFVRALAPAGDDERVTGYRPGDTLLVGIDQGDRRALADLHDAHTARGLAAEPLAARDARALEPLLGPRVTSAYRIPGDHRVDPRTLAARLLRSLEEHDGVRIVRERVAAVRRASADPDAPVTGVRLAGGLVLDAGEVVLANALGAGAVDGLPVRLGAALRPVHGDILRLRVPERLRPLLGMTVRALVRGESVYLVPRRDGTLVIGATQREDGLDGVSAAGVHRLLRDAQEVLPAVAELELLEATARARPATPDNAPLLGRVRDGRGGDVPGLIVATGFFRHGVLLAPLAAEICAGLVDGRADPLARPFRPDRFAEASLASVPPASAQPAFRSVDLEPAGLRSADPGTVRRLRSRRDPPMIVLTVNGEPHAAAAPLTLADLVAERTGIRVTAAGTTADGAALGIAAAVNASIVPRSAWAAAELADGDAVEIVTATQGG
ncbi:glycine oxidase ThiO [Microbacterium sp. 22242]|uniref:glycine oxidase ThiO n=1 Tax=Microbacterium sp. 22242 TaxID=3453896 RepID=UPI003F86CE89